MKCQKCSSYAINDDPEGLLCDTCWRDAKIERLLRERDEARHKLEVLQELVDGYAE